MIIITDYNGYLIVSPCLKKHKLVCLNKLKKHLLYTLCDTGQF